MACTKSTLGNGQIIEEIFDYSKSFLFSDINSASRVTLLNINAGPNWFLYVVEQSD